MKVFVSSVMVDFQDYRDAAATAARALGHEVKRAEDFGASPDSPQQACLAGVRWGEVILLLLGERYGQPQASGLSATHEEYREAKDRSTVLAFVKETAEREDPQETFVREVRDWTRGVYTAEFSSIEQLRDAVIRALHELELSRQAGSADEAEMLARARTLVPEHRGIVASALTVIVASGPQQEIVRPSELEDPELIRDVQREALLGDVPVLDPSRGTRTDVRGNTLTLEQDNASVLLDQLGTIRVIQPAQREEDRRGMQLPALIEEDVRDILHRGLRFAGWLMERVDPTRRISDVVPIASLQRGSLTWRTRAEHERNPNTGRMSIGPDPITVHLMPARRHRAVLVQALPATVDDLTVLLRRGVLAS